MLLANCWNARPATLRILLYRKSPAWATGELMRPAVRCSRLWVDLRWLSVYNPNALTQF